MTEEARVSTHASADDERGPSKSARVSTMGWLSFFTMFAIGTDTFLVAPLLPLLQRELDVPLSRAGWLVSAYALGYALFALVAGPVSDRHDRRRVILSGLAAFAVLTCACGLAWSFWSMVAARFLAGVSAAFVSSQIWASIPLTVPRPSIITVMGYATAGLAVAQVAGVPIGSYLSVRGWQLPFFVVAAVSVVLWGLLFLAFPHVRPVGESVDVVGSYRRVLGSRVLRWSLLAYLVFQTGNYASFSFIGSWLAKDWEPRWGRSSVRGSSQGSVSGGRCGPASSSRARSTSWLRRCPSLRTPCGAPSSPSPRPWWSPASFCRFSWGSCRLTPARREEPSPHCRTRRCTSVPRSPAPSAETFSPDSPVSGAPAS